MKMTYCLMSCLSVLLWSAVVLGTDPAPKVFFPIMAWSGAPDDPAALAKMRDCGITVVGPTPLSKLNVCQAAGLKVLIQDDRASSYGNWQGIDEAAAKKNIAALVEETAKHPAAIGYYRMDEPHAALFPGLAKVAGDVQAAALNAIPFINILPNYATPEQFGAKTYDDYVERFVEVCKPSIISYDHYALLDDGNLRDGYYQNLESVRRVAIKHHIPFWNVVLAVGHMSYRVPTQADFAFQAYTTLANGGGGIVYFMYLNPTVGNYRGAPIDQFGHETETWGHMRYVNLQVLQLAPIITKLKSNDIYHIGEVPHDCHGASKDTLVKSIAGGNFLVGDFTHENGSRYVMIVNKDLKKSHYIDVAFNKPAKKTMLIQPWNGGEDDFAGEQAWLAPGQGALLRLEQ